ncbi:hypothetical protein JZ751_009971 [Albula glossodonta]|uniref:Uncharacterized protein n=1 Tax=Albula glossodonta TaxID=121402 RepID=A0A8T2NZ43_9TELE|nr:hypothetical protein JZ751_009971 [Albula glossodonta]
MGMECRGQSGGLEKPDQKKPHHSKADTVPGSIEFRQSFTDIPSATSLASSIRVSVVFSCPLVSTFSMCQERECRVRVIWRRRLSGMEQCVKEVQTAVTVLMLIDRTCNAEYFRRQHRSGRDTLIYSSYQAHAPTILTHTPMPHNGAFATYFHPLMVVAGTRVAFVWWKRGTSGGKEAGQRNGKDMSHSDMGGHCSQQWGEGGQ